MKFPDLRFNQTPESDEKQPEVELENPIVTKEEYEKEKQLTRGEDIIQVDEETPTISEDEFNAELDKKSTEPNKPNPFEQKNETSITDEEQVVPEKSKNTRK